MCKENYQVMEQQLFRINRLINHIQENAYNNEIYRDIFSLISIVYYNVFTMRYDWFLVACTSDGDCAVGICIGGYCEGMFDDLYIYSMF